MLMRLRRTVVLYYGKFPSGVSLEYHAKFLSLSKPQGEDVFEFLIVTKDQIGVTSKITGEFALHNVDILTIDGANDPTTGQFVLSLFCDLSKANCTAKSITDAIREFPFVTKADYVTAKGRLFDSFHFPLRIMNKHRALIIRADPLLEVEKHLVEVLGSAGDTVMFVEGKTYASKTWMHLKNALPNASHEELLQNVMDGLRATGWGLFEFRSEQNLFHVSIRNPPKLENLKTSQSLFVRGIAVGTVESLHGVKVTVRDASYDDKSDTVQLTLENSTHPLQVHQTSQVLT